MVYSPIIVVNILSCFLLLWMLFLLLLLLPLILLLIKLHWKNTQTEFMAFTKCVGCINAVKLPILQLHQNNIYNVIIFKPCTLPSILALKMLTYTARTNIKCKDTNSKDENKSSDRFGP